MVSASPARRTRPREPSRSPTSPSIRPSTTRIPGVTATRTALPARNCNFSGRPPLGAGDLLRGLPLTGEVEVRLRNRGHRLVVVDLPLMPVADGLLPDTATDREPH